MTLQVRVGGALLLVAGLALLGCKKVNPNAPPTVSGKVTLNGSAVTGGTIVFHGADGSINQAVISPEGTYFAPDMPEGDMTVTIDTEALNPDKKTPDYNIKGGGGFAQKYSKGGGGNVVAGKKQEKEPMPQGAAERTGTYVKIPDKYKDPAKSDLKCTLKKGEQTQDFALTG